MNEALESFRKAIAADPRSPELLRQMGETLTLARLYKEADEAYDRTILLAPDNEFAPATKANSIMLWTGDIDRAGKIIHDAIEVSHNRSELVLSTKMRIEWYRGNRTGAEAAVQELRTSGNIDNQFMYLPLSLVQARIEQTLGNPASAPPLLEEARNHLEAKIAATPDDARFHSTLGVTLAYLGKKDDAIREAKRGIELLPVEKEAWRGSYRLIDLAEAYTAVGEQEKALDLLERLVTIPADFSRQLLNLEPRWKPLKQNKRFQALVTATY